ncbi:MAG: aminotransferase class I/II-fold pyridoxal phosphate-dependent enzyme [Bacteroidales bacterium]|nr:aminotransferase class I/II-fold pyridoxal phosphate-dependent enzyme [Bacteroidales bacterium]
MVARDDLVWLCNPNNPTGSVMAAGKVREMVLDKRKTFVIDQSYGFFTGEPLMTAAEAVATGNVLQLHSMTKRYAMPGLRLGYIVGSPQLMERLRNVRMPWIVNALAIEAGLYLTEHPDTAPIDKPALLAEAQRLRAELNGLPAIEVRPTSTHFMLCEIKTGTAADLKDWLMEHHGLLIRDASNFEGLGQGHFRIATQTREENDLLISAIKEFMQK